MRNLSESAWVRLPLKLLRENGLTKSAALVCCVLLDLATTAENLSAWITVSIPNLSDATGYKRSSVIRALNELEHLGLIERERNRFKGTSNRYRLKLECIELCGCAAALKQRRHKRSTDELDESAYLALVNNFKEDEDEYKA